MVRPKATGRLDIFLAHACAYAYVRRESLEKWSLSPDQGHPPTPVREGKSPMTAQSNPQLLQLLLSRAQAARAVLAAALVAGDTEAAHQAKMIIDGASMLAACVPPVQPGAAREALDSAELVLVNLQAQLANLESCPAREELLEQSAGWRKATTDPLAAVMAVWALDAQVSALTGGAVHG